MFEISSFNGKFGKLLVQQHEPFFRLYSFFSMTVKVYLVIFLPSGDDSL